MSLYFEEIGSKESPTILLIHGGGVSGWMWKRQVEFLKGYHLLIPDLPEHGKSMEAGPLNIWDSTAELARIIEEKANGGKAYVIGHSLGGKIAVELIASRPDLVIGAVVASALFRPMKMLLAMHRPYIYKTAVWMMKSKRIARMQVSMFRFPDETYNASCIKDFQSLTPDRLFREYDALYQNLKLPEGLRNSNVPTLVLAGEKEPKAMKESVRDIVGALPNSKGAYVAKGNHTYPWSMYEGFNLIIGAWIKERKVSGDIVKDVFGEE